MSLEEARGHLVLAEEKLVAARLLLEEDLVRDAASRAYYAMFHAAYALVRLRGAAPKTHRGLLSTFADEYVRKGAFPQDLFEAFRSGQSLREQGDYEPSQPPTPEEAEAVISAAARFLDAARVRIS